METSAGPISYNALCDLSRSHVIGSRRANEDSGDALVGTVTRGTALVTLAALAELVTLCALVALCRLSQREESFSPRQ